MYDENMMKSRKVNTQYGILQGLYWMCFCAFISFASSYLQKKGYSGTETGVILASGNIIAMLAQPVLSDLADQSRKWNAARISICLSLIALICSLIRMLYSTKSLLLSVMTAVSIGGISAMNPFITSVMYLLEKKDTHINFGFCRAIGSLFYALISSFLGILIDKVSSDCIPAAGLLLAVMLLILLLVILRQSSHIPQENEEKNHAGGYYELFHTHPKFLVLLIGVTFLYFAHCYQNNFMNLLVQNVGGTSSDMGRLMSFMALTELPSMFLSDLLIHKFTVQKLFIFSALMYSVKAVLLYFARSMTGLFFAMAFQSVSFALFLPVSVYYASAIFNEHDHVKAQTGFVLCNTAATILSSLIGGRLSDQIGISMTLLTVMLVSVIGTILTIPSMEKEKQ